MPWVKGQSGNPRGRPKAETAEVKDWARKVWKASARKRLEELVRSPDDKVALAACKEVADRLWGRSAQPVTGEAGEGPVMVQATVRLVPAGGAAGGERADG